MKTPGNARENLRKAAGAAVLEMRGETPIQELLSEVELLKRAVGRAKPGTSAGQSTMQGGPSTPQGGPSTPQGSPSTTQGSPSTRQADPSTTHPGPSAKQLEANRANARRSTGPRTEQGKARSSRNAMRHGLFSKLPLLPGEDPKELAQLTLDLLLTYQPREEEAYLVHRLVHKEWMLKRIQAAQVEMGRMLEAQGKTGAVALAEDYLGTGSGGILRMMNHEMRIGNSIVSLRNKLAKLQKNRDEYNSDGLEELMAYCDQSLKDFLGGSNAPLDGTNPIPIGAAAESENKANSGAELSAAIQNEPESRGSAPPEALVA